MGERLASNYGVGADRAVPLQPLSATDVTCCIQLQTSNARLETDGHRLQLGQRNNIRMKAKCTKLRPMRAEPCALSKVKCVWKLISLTDATNIHYRAELRQHLTSSSQATGNFLIKNTIIISLEVNGQYGTNVKYGNMFRRSYTSFWSTVQLLCKHTREQLVKTIFLLRSGKWHRDINTAKANK